MLQYRKTFILCINIIALWGLFQLRVDTVFSQTSSASVWVFNPAPDYTITSSDLQTNWGSFSPHPPFDMIDTQDYDPANQIQVMTYGPYLWIWNPSLQTFSQTTISQYWSGYDPGPPSDGIDTLAFGVDGTAWITKGDQFWTLRTDGSSITGNMSTSWAGYINRPLTEYGALDSVTLDSINDRFIYTKNNAIWVFENGNFVGPSNFHTYWQDYGIDIPPVSGIDTLMYLPSNGRYVAVKNTQYKNPLDLSDYLDPLYQPGYQWYFQGKNYQFQEQLEWGVPFHTLIQAEKEVNHCGQRMVPLRYSKDKVEGYWRPKRADADRWPGTSNLRWFLSHPAQIDNWQQTLYYQFGDKNYAFNYSIPLQGDFDNLLSGHNYVSFTDRYPAYFYAPKIIDAQKGYYFFGNQSKYRLFGIETNECDTSVYPPAEGGWIVKISILPNIVTPYYSGEVLQLSFYEFGLPFMEAWILREDWFLAKDIGHIGVHQKYFNETSFAECPEPQKSAGKCGRECLLTGSSNDFDCTAVIMQDPYVKTELIDFYSNEIFEAIFDKAVVSPDQSYHVSLSKPYSGKVKYELQYVDLDSNTESRNGYFPGWFSVGQDVVKVENIEGLYKYRFQPALLENETNESDETPITSDPTWWTSWQNIKVINPKTLVQKYNQTYTQDHAADINSDLLTNAVDFVYLKE